MLLGMNDDTTWPWSYVETMRREQEFYEQLKKAAAVIAENETAIYRACLEPDDKQRGAVQLVMKSGEAE